MYFIFKTEKTGDFVYRNFLDEANLPKHCTSFSVEKNQKYLNGMISNIYKIMQHNIMSGKLKIHLNISCNLYHKSHCAS